MEPLAPYLIFYHTSPEEVLKSIGRYIFGSWSCIIWKGIKSQGFHLKFIHQKQHTQSLRNVTLFGRIPNRTLPFENMPWPVILISIWHLTFIQNSADLNEILAQKADIFAFKYKNVVTRGPNNKQTRQAQDSPTLEAKQLRRAGLSHLW